MDDLGNIYYTQGSRLTILNSKGKTLKEIESIYSSDIFVGDILNIPIEKSSTAKFMHATVELLL
ncbi:MAG: hypothetical protein GX072_06250 [Lysinibacillus sp.]|nr:hypothetical protein [Lysinibacillus sp.]